jgi:tRNA-dihydrouridine synthase
MFKGFWEKLSKPIIGLSPMDGVTDAAFRYITAKYGHPSVTFTEFIPVEGVCRGVLRLMDDFKYSEIERPIVAQVFGSNPESFYKVSFLVAALGFDGIDINMGCPDKSISLKQGAGAGLILKPQLAKEIVRACQAGITDFANGKKLADIGLPSALLHYVQSIKGEDEVPGGERVEIPVSVKTRLGFDSVIIEDWVKDLLEAQPAVIIIHGRTLKQMYRDSADWDSIARAARIAQGSNILILGNGDIKDYQEALQKIEQYDVSGVLIGRASFGNPWVFNKNSNDHSTEEKLRVMVEQAQYFAQFLKNKPFVNMRKNFGWYCRGFEGASQLRTNLMEAVSLDDVTLIVDNFLIKH